MRIDQLQYIVTIADCGSVTEAAEKLHVSQPSISLSIASLEEELNIRIFSRSRLGTHPTENGKLIIQKAREMLYFAEEMKNIAQNNNSTLSGTLSIATVPSFCATLLPKSIGVFKNNFPNVQIDIIEEGTIQIENHLLKHNVDIGLTSNRGPNLSPRLSFMPIIPSEIMACVNKQSALANKKKIKFADIINYPIVILNSEYRIHNIILERLKSYGNPNILLTARNPSSIKNIILEGLAIGFDTDISLKTDPYVSNGDIIPLKLAEQTKTFFGILHIKKELSAASKEFIKILKTQALNFSRIYNIKPIS